MAIDGLAPFDKFQVTNVANQAPGVCFTCKGNTGPFLDTGMSHEWFDQPSAGYDGVVYVCFNCVKEMARTIGFVDDAQNLRAERMWQEGRLSGILSGKRLLDEFANSFIDTCLVTGPRITGTIIYGDENLIEGPQREPGNSTSVIEGDRQVSLDDSSGRPDDISGDTTAGDLFVSPPVGGKRTKVGG